MKDEMIREEEVEKHGSQGIGMIIDMCIEIAQDYNRSSSIMIVNQKLKSVRNKVRLVWGLLDDSSHGGEWDDIIWKLELQAGGIF